MNISRGTAMLAAALAALAGAPTSPARAADDEIVIGVAMPGREVPRWRFDVAEMRAAAEELGARLRVQWANGMPDEQSWQVEALIVEDVDVLIVTAVAGDAAGTLVAEANDAGIPVIAYDRAIPNADIAYFLTRDNAQVGELQVQAALAFAPPDADNPPAYALINGDHNQRAAREIADAYEAALAPHVADGSVRIVDDRWHPAWSMMAARNSAQVALMRGDVDAFVASNDSLALGVASAVMNFGTAGDVFISGLDADVVNDHLIVQGVISMTVWTEIDRMAREAVAAAVTLANGEIPASDTSIDNGFGPVPTALIEVVEVTADNMCAWILDIAPDGWASVEDVYGQLAPPDECEAAE